MHRGKILENIIKESDLDKTQIAKRAGYNRSSLYRHIGADDLELDILLKYGKVLKHDFSKEIPELIEYASQVEEPLSEYKAITVSEALRERDYWKDKYIRLLEKHNELIESNLRRN